MITGIGDGLGRETALRLAARDYRVYGVTLSQRAAAELNSVPSGAITASVGDITDEGAVKSWVAKVSDALGQGGLDVLISNAGSLTPGPLEVLPPDVLRHDIEVNVLGALRVINGLLPALHTARGRIVHLSAPPCASPLRSVTGMARRIRWRRRSGTPIAVCSSRSGATSSLSGEGVRTAGRRRRGPACGGSRSR